MYGISGCQLAPQLDSAFTKFSMTEDIKGVEHVMLPTSDVYNRAIMGMGSYMKHGIFLHFFAVIFLFPISFSSVQLFNDLFFYILVQFNSNIKMQSRRLAR